MDGSSIIEYGPQLLQSNIDREKRLKEVKKLGNTEQTRADIQRLLTAIRLDYRKLLIQHTAYCSTVGRDGRDIDGLLWKTCFYKQIEEYRRSLLKHSKLCNTKTPDTPAYNKEV